MIKRTIFLFFLANSAFAQNKSLGLVEYNMVLSFKDKVNQSTLLINKNDSYFLWNSKSNDSLKIKEKETNEGNLNISFKKEDYTDNIGFFNYKSNKRNHIITRTFLGKKEYFVTEIKPQIKWNVFEEYKKIGNFDCQKAKAKFRGRNYTVWFTYDIPISDGPWKLHGLPGLILEAYDDKKEVSFFFKSAKFPDNTQKSRLKISENKKISLKEFVLLKEKHTNNIFNKNALQESLKAKLPRNVKIDIKVSKKVNAIELDFNDIKK